MYSTDDGKLVPSERVSIKQMILAGMAKLPVLSVHLLDICNSPRSGLYVDLEGYDLAKFCEFNT